MHTFTRLLIAVFIGTVETDFAQSSAKPGQQNQADLDWVAVKTLATPTSNKGGNKTADQAKADRKQQADQLWQASLSAKDFATKNPGNSNAPEAKKLAALAAMQSAQLTDGDRDQSALQIAGDYRSNKNNPAKDRFEVAQAMEQLQVTRKLGGQPWLRSPVESEQMTDRLRDEFGGTQEVYGSYLQIAQNTICYNAGDVARKILQADDAPTGVRAEAQCVLDRWNLLGQPLDLALTTTAGNTIRLSQFTGKTVVLYVGSSGLLDAGGLAGVTQLQRSAPSATEWVVVSLGAKSPSGQGAKAPALAKGSLCVEPLGSPATATLKLSHLPYVYIVDAKGALAGYGRPDELSTLLANLNSWKIDR